MRHLKGRAVILLKGAAWLMIYLFLERDQVMKSIYCLIYTKKFVLVIYHLGEVFKASSRPPLPNLTLSSSSQRSSFLYFHFFSNLTFCLASTWAKVYAFFRPFSCTAKPKPLKKPSGSFFSTAHDAKKKVCDQKLRSYLLFQSVRSAAFPCMLGPLLF